MSENKAREPITYGRQLQQEWQKISDKIQEHHIHIYHEPETDSKETAQQVADKLSALFKGYVIKTSSGEASGPHLKPNFLVHVQPEILGEVVSWLQFNHQGLSIAIHPKTGNGLTDHRDHSIWFGKQIGYSTEFMEKMKRKYEP
ncbi:MAG: DOPA 4,5-dioxygenase family protein [Alphaproteobacteria bacterium]|nr:DOPA 4,5-dioxygenase family protein [Alphaproteobacteria bacterium]